MYVMYVMCVMYVMLCYVMLCYAMLCYVVLWYVMLCYVTLCMYAMADAPNTNDVRDLHGVQHPRHALICARALCARIVCAMPFNNGVDVLRSVPQKPDDTRCPSQTVTIKVVARRCETSGKHACPGTHVGYREQRMCARTWSPHSTQGCTAEGRIPAFRTAPLPGNYSVG